MNNRNDNIVADVLDAIATVFVFLVMGALAVVFLAITGCSTKSVKIHPQLEPTYQVTTNDNGELEIIVKECILNSVRESIPIENILRSYLDETEEEIEEEVEEKWNKKLKMKLEEEFWPS